MYTLIRSISFRSLFLEQILTFGLSLVIAESFYKFHSFTLECMAFLATWYVLDAAIQNVGNKTRTVHGRTSDDGR